MRGTQRRRGERGAARFNLVIVIALVALVGYAAYHYAPVAYGAFLFKDFMQETVEKAAHAGQPLGAVESQLRAKAKELGLPADATYTVQNEDGRVSARVRWTRPVSLPGYVYDYEFDHTARSRGLIR
jgi:hypothetical protein